ncbi:uncharacterized protein K460DRAFT_405826 [Cucurbitaria berberidis CBS 394.84]|uniref:Ribonuclease H n=1 Tax=Cucurbitaria berberidis CBS 394.84 TaxID=1168544 RepID=A0A9P4L8P8_9PLEO|nr:uncharacterized protein K460DRAFT_405826 [Cucurbitaria berberidis CBS 394.84]KAF1845572.1 hypothetical protein K460DRAFT_405826 [Cucurbitaria berberidis CBS 394.84]
MVKKPKPNFYAIHLPCSYAGVYEDWSEVKPRIEGRGRAEYKGFQTRHEAVFFSETGYQGQKALRSSGRPGPSRTPSQTLPPARMQASTPYPTTSMNKPNEQPNYNTEETNGERFADVEHESAFRKYYAVANGRKPGLYVTWDGEGGAKEQVTRFSNAKFKGFENREAAIHYMCKNGFLQDEIKSFGMAFKALVNFTPRPTAPFEDEFRRYAASQDLYGPEMRKAKIDAIRDDLIRHFLPNGITVDQEDEEEGIILTEDQTLKIYQGMCRLAGKHIPGDIDECLWELKSQPFVNIMDFVNTFRTGERVRTFNSWDDFVNYTVNGHRIDVQYAKDNEFLAPLLQDLRKGPGSVDPTSVRRAFIARRAERMRARQRYLPPVKREPLTTLPEASLSPPASDFSPPPSRSPTPDLDPLPELDSPRSASDESETPSISPARGLDPLTPAFLHATLAPNEPQIKLEPSSPTMPANPIPPPKAAQVPLVRETPSTPTKPRRIQTRSSTKRARALPPDAELPGTQRTKRRKTQGKPGCHGSDIRGFFRAT